MRQPAVPAPPAPPGAASPPQARPRFPAWLLALALGLVTVALYWPATRQAFINYDDDLFVYQNPHVQRGLNWEAIQWAFGNTEQAAYWAPLLWLSHILAWQFFGMNAGGHHLLNVLLHAANTALVFLVLRRLTRADWRSLMVAALFGLHPLRVESVAWVTERKDVLGGCFALLTLLAYARYVEVQSPESKAQSPKSGVRGPWSLSPLPSSLFYLLALLLFALGLMSKPVLLVTLPCVMLLLDYWPLGRMQNAECRMRNDDAVATQPATRNPLILLEKLPFFALSAVAGFLTVVAQRQAGALASSASFPLGARAGNALISYCRYLGKLFWPSDLAIFYPHPGYWPLAEVLLAGLGLLGISTLLVVERRRHPYLLVGWLWFCGTLVPVIQLVQASSCAMADRFTYLPSLGWLILTVWGACELTRPWRSGPGRIQAEDNHRWTRMNPDEDGSNPRSPRGQASSPDSGTAQGEERPRSSPQNLCSSVSICGWTESSRHGVLSVTGAAAVLVCLALTRQQLAYWRDSEALFRHALAVTEDNQVAHKVLADTLDHRGRTDEAIFHYQAALSLKPGYADAHNNLGIAFARKGQLDEALRQFQEAIRLKPAHANAHYNLGTALATKGQVAEAIRQYEEAIRRKPGYAEAHYNLGLALGGQGRTDEAIRQYREALRLRPDHAEACNELGIALGRKGQMIDAIRQFQEATRLKPDFPEAHYNLGLALGLNGQTDEAVRQYQQALKLKPDYADARKSLDLALAKRARAPSPPAPATPP